MYHPGKHIVPLEHSLCGNHEGHNPLPGFYLLHVVQDTNTSWSRRCIMSGAGCTERGTKFTLSLQHGH